MAKKNTLIADAALENIKSIGGPEIRRLRLRAKLSQAEFASHFNRTGSYISRLERGTRQPKGPALALLNVIRRKGFEAIL